jgi:undecaprenyl-diphosphatase
MELTLIQTLILGLIQGITEWLPISSSAMSSFVMVNFFDIIYPIELLKIGLFFHLGTFFAALIYFNKDVLKLIKTIFNYKNTDVETKNIFNFLLISTLISGIIGIILLKIFYSLQDSFEFTGKLITLSIGILLLITGIFQLKIKKIGLRKEKDLKTSEGFLLGFFQGLSSLPGLSRSGTTVSVLLLKKFDDTTALRLSFLMSLPIVLAGNILLNFGDFAFSMNAFYGLLVSFILGISTIHLLIRFSKKINFGWFVLIIALLMMVSIFI